MAAKEIKQTSAKLGNAGFLAKAPENVVAEIRLVTLRRRRGERTG